MKTRIKRWMFLVHRWFGVAMCGLFALWFATGVIMMYVEYPELTEDERLAALPPLDPAEVAVSVDRAAELSGIHPVAAVSLSSIGTRPAYRVRGESGELAVVYADDGRRRSGTSPAGALEAVELSGFAPPGLAPRYDGAIDMDQWTVSAVLDEHRPLHRVVVDDRAGTVVYVSATTGQIVRDTNRAERVWNWLGSTLHWIYPFQLRRHADLWSNLLIYLSVAGIVSVATGAVVGTLRLRLTNRYRGTDVSPYRGAAKWHHLLGLLSLAFLGTFTFSGLMSMTPWGLFDSTSSETEQIGRFTGGPIGSFEHYPPFTPDALPRGVKEVEWRQVASVGHLVLSRSARDRHVIVGGFGSAAAGAELRRRIEAALPAFLPGSRAISVAVLDDYDDYYYSRHNRYRPLPAYEVRFDDPEATWFYVDAATGAVVMRYTAAARTQRWLYNGLHSLDFAFLLRRGVLWDVTVIALCAFGFVFSVTAVIVGVRRVRRSTHKPRRPALTPRAQLFNR